MWGSVPAPGAPKMKKGRCGAKKTGPAAAGQAEKIPPTQQTHCIRGTDHGKCPAQAVARRPGGLGHAVQKSRAASDKDAALAGFGNGEKDLRQKGAGENHSRSSQAKP